MQSDAVSDRVISPIGGMQTDADKQAPPVVSSTNDRSGESPRQHPDRNELSDSADDDFVKSAVVDEDTTVGGEGAIGGGEGIDDGGTHGGGTDAAPSDEELLEARRHFIGSQQEQ